MTNVPQRIRDLWSDIYVLFDKNYLMENTEDAWGSFWQQAMQIRSKYDKCPYLTKMFDLVTMMIEDRMKTEHTHHPHTLEDMDLF